MEKSLKKTLTMTLLSCACLGVVLTTGCAKTQSTMTPDDKAKFGTYGQPMPEAAKKYMQDHAAKAQPPGPQAAPKQ